MELDMKTITYDTELFLTLSKGKLTIRGVHEEVQDAQNKQKEKNDGIETTEQYGREDGRSGGTNGWIDNSEGIASSGANTAVVTGSSYVAQGSEFYIGVDSKEQSTIYLPANPADGKVLIIKSEMKPPMSNRKITIKPSEGHTVDGYSEFVMTVSHDCKRLLFRNNCWNII